MADLQANDFDAFFRAVHNESPFPWQRRLVEEIVSTGAWPGALKLPTGAGKTAALDVAVFCLALALERKTVPRHTPLRTVFVVDRRIIVDAAYDRAKKIASSIENSSEPAVISVRNALRSIGRGAPFRALHVERLRGGVPRERDWTPSPSHPTILLSTVDQVGSRLLFRGYGISEGMRSIHAGLLGEDALILLDEVHLSEPFRQTLEAISLRVAPGQPLPWKVVELSATPRVAGMPFELSDADRTNPTLKMRLEASKPARIEKVAGGVDAVAREYAEKALRLTPLAGGHARRVLVVVNRVDAARRIFEHLTHDLAQPTWQEKADAVGVPIIPPLLLIGRARDADRKRITDTILSRAALRRENASPEEALFILVATQTVEAGADLDFDALVTQIAPLDALRQRFGRVDRAGRATAMGRVPTGLIVVPAEDVVKNSDDPVYGNRLRATAEWLFERQDEPLDFGINAMGRTLEGVDKDTLAGITSEAIDAPILMPSHVRLLEMTRPSPALEPAVKLFLHGPGTDADVSIVWRADVPLPGSDGALTTSILAAVPPRVPETMQLPIWTAQRWLGEIAESRKPRRDDEAWNVADAPEREADARATSTGTKAAWRWSRTERRAEPVSAREIIAGDVLVVPSSYGGCDEFGWNPSATEPVRDLADQAGEAFRISSDAVRLHPALLRQELVVSDGELHDDDLDAESTLRWRKITSAAAGIGDAREVLQAVRDSGELGPTSLRAVERLLKSTRSRLTVLEYPSRDGAWGGVIVAAPRGSASRASSEDDGLEATTEDERSALGADSYPLLRHGEDVERIARDSACDIGLEASVVADIALAGRLHDLGKADPRFQRYLRATRWTEHEQLVAKSLQARDRAGDRRARRLAGLPPRWRHEVVSVRIAPHHPDFAAANDPELVLWLLGTHHGWGRPFFSHEDPQHDEPLELEELSAGLRVPQCYAPHRSEWTLSTIDANGAVEVSWSKMRVRLAARYGAWRLALFESLVRLADHRASAAYAAATKEALA